MPETKRRRAKRAEFTVAIAIAVVVMTGAYLIADQWPFPIALVVVLGVAGGLTALATYGMDRPEARR
ncbi:hypothetical protein ACFYXD_35410 [Streptomyces platensis]|uniref:hypothetical protein n=1 Tax=Streptomyces platensis TaxID=58346 RepID=UPI0036AE0948